MIVIVGMQHQKLNGQITVMMFAPIIVVFTMGTVAGLMKTALSDCTGTQLMRAMEVRQVRQIAALHGMLAIIKTQGAQIVMLLKLNVFAPATNKCSIKKEITIKNRVDAQWI